MAVYAALVSLMNTIKDITNHPQISTFFNNKHTQTLFEKTSSLLDFIEANNYGTEAEDLEREITSAAQAVDDMIDFHIMDQIYDQTSLKRSLDLQQQIHDMDVVMKKANEFKRKQRSGEEKGVDIHVPVAVMEIEETVMVGLDAELNKLLEELTREPKSNRQTISIVGMGGMGKTTLAKSIFENKLIKHHFDFRAWATIYQQHNAREILVQLLPLSEKSSHQSINEMGEELYKNLFGRRYLIILDDIWCAKALDEVRLFFPDNKNGSKIVLTTRLSSVAIDCSSFLFMMRFLDKGNSWKLFCEKTFKNESCPLELHEVGEDIIELCRGLALSIVVMGGLLSKSPRTVEYWKIVVRDIKLISGGSLDVLSLSYNHLPAHLKPCFLYMGLFDEDSEIHVSEVVRLWIDEGFIKPSACGVLEKIGEGYIKDLIDRNLLSVRRWRKNGKIKCCGIHDLLRDLCIKIGEQQKFFSLSQAPNPTERRLILRIADFNRYRIPRARCILASLTYGQPIKQGLLRVFKTRCTVDSPENLYENVNLRHLSYEENISDGSLRELPTSVSLMWNLQTLIVATRSFNVVVPPIEIWKMRQLRYVACGDIYLPPYNQQDQDELLILENLQTLKGALNLRLCKEVCEAIPNIIKLYLCYDESMYGYDDCLIDYLCNLDLMHKLESLRLEIFNNKLYKKPTFPNSLKKLVLHGCGFDWDDLVTIGWLPLLEILVLHWSPVAGHRWSPTTGQFLRLKFLKLDQIDLKYWDADDSHFPVLEKLVLFWMSKLEEIPLGFGHIPTLELICVDRCNVSTAISALKIKEDQIDYENDSLQIQIRVDGSRMEDFKEKSELEGLSISNLQLESGWFYC